VTDAADAAALAGGWTRARRVLKEWAWLAGALLLLHLLLFASWAALDAQRIRSLAPMLTLAGIYVVLLAVVLVVFVRRLGLANVPREIREAHECGIPATAVVLAIEKTGWRSPRSRNFKLELRPRRYAYAILLRVSRPGEPDYDARAFEYLLSAETPERGATVAVRVHPHRPEVLVLARSPEGEGTSPGAA
jgi:hypothetical protein